MIVFPNCKINLGLNIVSKRTDGFHNLETIFYPLTLSDALEIIPSPATETAFTSSGLFIPGNNADNLCVKAWRLMHNKYNIPPVQIHLHKVIPMGAGLGGGSTDAAFTLKVLNELFGLSLSVDELKHLAALLGSDCAFFIENTPCFASGRGEILTPVDLNLQSLKLMLVTPPVHVPTREAFAGIVAKTPEYNLRESIALPLEEWKNRVCNDFEEGIFSKYPLICNIREKLYKMGAIYASMSGSGSSVFGIFRNDLQHPSPEDEFEGYFIHEEYLK
jgi:4-diphosphocytidyl-2-C-methyl-D-erythritol kinase